MLVLGAGGWLLNVGVDEAIVRYELIAAWVLDQLSLHFSEIFDDPTDAPRWVWAIVGAVGLWATTELFALGARVLALRFDRLSSRVALARTGGVYLDPDTGQTSVVSSVSEVFDERRERASAMYREVSARLSAQRVILEDDLVRLERREAELKRQLAGLGAPEEAGFIDDVAGPEFDDLPDSADTPDLTVEDLVQSDPSASPASDPAPPDASSGDGSPASVSPPPPSPSSPLPATPGEPTGGGSSDVEAPFLDDRAREAAYARLDSQAADYEEEQPSKPVSASPAPPELLEQYEEPADLLADSEGFDTDWKPPVDYGLSSPTAGLSPGDEARAMERGDDDEDDADLGSVLIEADGSLGDDAVTLYGDPLASMVDDAVKSLAQGERESHIASADREGQDQDLRSVESYAAAEAAGVHDGEILGPDGTLPGSISVHRVVPVQESPPPSLDLASPALAVSGSQPAPPRDVLGPPVSTPAPPVSPAPVPVPHTLSSLDRYAGLPVPEWDLRTALGDIGSLLYVEYRAADLSFVHGGPAAPDIAEEVIQVLSAVASRYDFRPVVDLPPMRRDMFPHLCSLVEKGLLEPASQHDVAARLRADLMDRRRQYFTSMTIASEGLRAMRDTPSQRLGEFVSGLLDAGRFADEPFEGMLPSEGS